MTENAVILESLLTDSSRIGREAAKRRSLFDQISVSKAEVEGFLADGWVLDRELKRKTCLKRARPFDTQLENRLWLLLYLMGYHELNAGRNFTVRIDRKGADPIRKQIDVFAKDEETVIVAECKASESLKRRSLQKDIEGLPILRDTWQTPSRNTMALTSSQRLSGFS